MQNYNDQIVTYFFGISLTLLFLFSLIYQTFCWRKKNIFSNYSLQLQIKKIVTVSLFAATSVAVLFIFSQFVAITVIPSIRIAFEGVLVNIVGFIFGPIVGLITAVITEFAVLVFIPTYFHYKFLLVLMSFGLLAGIVKIIVNFKKSNNWKFFVAFFGLFVLFILTHLFFYLNLKIKGNFSFGDWKNIWSAFKTKYLTAFSFKSLVFFANLLSFCLMFLLILAMSILINSKTKKVKFITKKTLLNVLPILILCIFSEYFVVVFISTSASQSVFGDDPRGGFIIFSFSMLIAPFKIIVNTFIIYQVWNACNAYINHNITD